MVEGFWLQGVPSDLYQERVGNWGGAVQLRQALKTSSENTLLVSEVPLSGLGQPGRVMVLGFGVRVYRRQTCHGH